MGRRNSNLYKMTVSGILLAVGLALPLLTGQIPAVAQIVSPLHIPVLICGLTCGWQWGLGLGLVLPILRGLTFGLPPFPNTALPMAFELGVYGVATGLLYPWLLKKMKKDNHLPALLAALIAAMICGRLVGGAAKGALLSFGIIGTRDPYTFAAFFASYFTGTAPGALIHIVLIPAIVLALEKAKLSPMTANV